MSDRFTFLLLRRADDALVFGHRIAEGCADAPDADPALSGIARDLIGQARALYGLAASRGGGEDEDVLAGLRSDREYHNLLLLERPNGDLAETVARVFLYAAFASLFWNAAGASRDREFAAIAAGAETQCAEHLRHAAEWLIRLGNDTAERHTRSQAALNRLWAYTGEMFEAEDPVLVAADICPDPPGLRDGWNVTVARALAAATLDRPRDGWMHAGGREGQHSEHLGHMLALMQSHPGAA